MSISANTPNTTITDRITLLNSQLDDLVVKLEAIAPALGIAVNQAHPLQRPLQPQVDATTPTINLDGALEVCQVQADIANDIIDEVIEKVGINFDANALSVGTVIIRENDGFTSDVSAERVGRQILNSRVKGSVKPVIASKVATKKRAR